MLKEKIDFYKKIAALVDAATITASFFSSFLLRKYFTKIYAWDLFPSVKVIENFPASIDGYWIIFLIAVPIWLFALFISGMYKSLWMQRAKIIVWMIVKSVFFIFVGLCAVFFIFDIEFVSRLFIAMFLIVGATALAIERVAFLHSLRMLRQRGRNIRRLLIVGTSENAIRIIDKIQQHQEYGFKIVGLIDDESGRNIQSIRGIHVIGTLADFPDILYNHAIDEVVFAVARSHLPHVENAINACETAGVRAALVIDLFNLKIARCRSAEFAGIPIVMFETTRAQEWQLFLKRTMDFVLSGLGILILSPAFFAIGGLVRLTSRGPALFRQERVGLNGRRFILYKFRTMYAHAEKIREKLEDHNEMSFPVFKIKNDPRVTKVGRILRKFSIDELPQLINVFAGQMSLVGPRALPVYEVDKFEPWQRRRLSMRPGLTCKWQTKGRNNIDFEEWMKLDLAYIDNWSLWHDLKILIKTVPVVLFGIGAY